MWRRAQRRAGANVDGSTPSDGAVDDKDDDIDDDDARLRAALFVKLHVQCGCVDVLVPARSDSKFIYYMRLLLSLFLKAFLFDFYSCIK